MGTLNIGFAILREPLCRLCFTFEQADRNLRAWVFFRSVSLH